jgi:hypothetical protein
MMAVSADSAAHGQLANDMQPTPLRHYRGQLIRDKTSDLVCLAMGTLVWVQAVGAEPTDPVRVGQVADQCPQRRRLDSVGDEASGEPGKD